MINDSGVETFVGEALAFTEKHSDLDGQQKTFGGLLWASMRAVAECPNCPGHFRIPYNRDRVANAFGDWFYLVCGNCHGVWTKEGTDAT